jgi:hypothetical protein
VPRRASLPGADLLFGTPSEGRGGLEAFVSPTPAPVEPVGDVPATAVEKAQPDSTPAAAAGPNFAPPEASTTPARRPKAEARTRPRHEEKVTFYCTNSDLTRLEAARLGLRAHHKLSTDRGRIVRAAIAEILDDFDARGAESSLVKRLSGE